MDKNQSKVYVGNLPYEVNTDQLKETFSEYGEVVDAIVITDRNTGRSKGFGFVEYKEDESAQKAIDAMNGKDFEGREIVVNIARPQRD